MSDSANKPKSSSRSFLATMKPSADGKKRSFKAPSSSSAASTAELEASRRRIKELEEELKSGKGVEVQSLDPNRVRQSSFANRNTLSLSAGDSDFDEFVDSLKKHGGNFVPARVRPVSGDPDHDYEIIYGHRRHRGSIIAGTMLGATVHDDVSDADLAMLMTLENRRIDPSPYEDGLHFRALLDAGVYAHAGELGEALDLHRSAVQHRLAINDLPKVIFLALGDPRKVNINGWRKIYKMFRSDRQSILLERASELVEQEDVTELRVLDEKQVEKVISYLLSDASSEPRERARLVSSSSGTPLFRIKKLARGTEIKFDSSGVAEEIQEEALLELERFLLQKLSS